MTKRGVLLVTALSLLLAGCGLIPPIDIGQDPFGFSGKTVTAVVGSSASLAVQAKTASGSLSLSFDNLDIGSAPNPSQIAANIGIAPTVSVSALDGVYPETISFEMAMSLNLSDAGGNFQAQAKISDITLNRSADCSGASSCSYTVAGTPSITELLFGGNAIGIIFAGPQPNTLNVSVSMNVNSSPELADGSSITVTFSGQGATAKL